MSNIINWLTDHSVDFVIYMVTQETGLLIGLALLIWGSFYLPKKVRRHVLTGGISIIIYQLGKNYYFRKQYAEAEEERIRLKQEKEELEKKGKELLDDLKGLKSRSVEIKEESAALEEEKIRLREADDFNPNEFDERIATLKEESDELDAMINALPVISKAVGEATHQARSAIQ